MTTLTLVVLCVYAWDTRRLAKNSSKQIEHAQRPCVTLVEQSAQNWFIENHGSGPALNITYWDTTNVEGVLTQVERPLSPLPAGGNSRIDAESGKRLWTGTKITYESLSGRRYETEIKYAKVVFRVVREG